jgi:phosphoglucomutase
LKDIADSVGVKSFDVLTGFKYIADIIKTLEGKMTFIAGGEESYGYLVGDFVRDKDAISSCCMIAETAAWAADQGKSMFVLLKEIYQKFGFYKESLVSVTKKGKSGAEEIKQMMHAFRTNPPKQIAGAEVAFIRDYELQKEVNLLNGQSTVIALPKSDVLQFFLKNGSKITVRPSGTEPKIKFYFGVKGVLNTVEEYAETDKLLDEQVKEIVKAMNL